MKKTPSPPKSQPLDSEARQAAEYAMVDAKAFLLLSLPACEGCGYHHARGGCLCKEYS